MSHLNKEHKMTQNQNVPTRLDLNRIVLDPNMTKSAKIRALHSMNCTRVQILTELKVLYPKMIYQHVRNVLVTQVKKPTE
jgi:ArsR family metal-binding transcriptional regulator